MATLETQIFDDVIVRSRRKLMTLGGAALAGLVVGGSTEKAYAASYSDSDILNFALNLEYLEANFYYLAAFGCLINTPNAAAIAAGAPAAGIPITGSVGTAGTVTYGAANKVPFTTAVAAYASETAIEEGKHVLFLQSALGSGMYIAQPAINLDPAGAWAMLVTAANANYSAVTIPTGFSPYSSDAAFLVGGYVFEDVGVTAYHGAASLLTSSGNLSAAGGILAVEGYHAGLLRTAINATDVANGNTTLTGYTNSISALRAALAASAQTAGGTSATVGGVNYDNNPDDFGLATFSVSLAGMAGFNSTRITDADTGSTLNTAIAFSRNTNQVLNIVTGGGKVASGAIKTTAATGVFFPAGLNAGPNGFK
jgi:hypothetical protein